MNYLAHIYLSGDNIQRQIGNFIGDHVKGKQWETYPKEIQKGILIHRFIDNYTDNHLLFLKCKSLFSPHYAKYSGVVTDIICDHFLAKNWMNYCTSDLHSFISLFYNQIQIYEEIIPEKIRSMIPKLQESQRVQNYATVEGILETLLIMSRYTSLPDHTKEVGTILHNENKKIEELFTLFFDELILELEQQFDYTIR